MPRLSKILLWSASLATLLFLGSLGYVLIEGWSFFDALYMTITTLTTVGYGEIHPLDQAGRAYTMVLILAGVGVMLYIVGALARVVVEGEIQAALGKRKIRRRVQKLKDHYIICGYGRLGKIIARQLSNAGISLVVVESDPEVIAKVEAQGYTFIAGDATREEVLLEAGIERAKGLVAVLHSDAGNVYITLTARSLNPRLFIVARGEEPGSQQKLLRAGADKVESPYEMGGAEDGPHHPAPHGYHLHGTGHAGGGGMEHGGDRRERTLPHGGGAPHGHGHPQGSGPHRRGCQAG